MVSALYPECGCVYFSKMEYFIMEMDKKGSWSDFYTFILILMINIVTPIIIS